MSPETRSRRRDRCRRVANRDERSHGPRRTPGMRPYKRERDPAASSDLTFNERHLENLFMLDGPVPKVAFFAEQLAMIRSDGDVRVLRNQIEQLFDHSVQILHGLDLTVAQFSELGIIEHFCPAPPQLAADDRLIQMLEDTVHAADARPLVLGLIRERVWIMRLAHIEQVERRL